MTLSKTATLAQYLAPGSKVDWGDIIPACEISNPSPYLQANSYFFGHPRWAKNYFEASHRDDAFKARWLAAAGSWDNKIVVEIGCGPGNVYATLGGSPRLLIGVDVSRGALEMARQVGYTPLLADAHNLPFISGFADIVAANAVVHHCDDMPKVLAEAARLVRPGGVLITDMDPQFTARNLKGLSLLLWNARTPVYERISRNYYLSRQERIERLATETHNGPGDGVIPKLYYETLEPLGFTVKLYFHNETIGAEALQGNYGRSHWRMRLLQRLSGINPDSAEAALSVLCIAKRNEV